MLTVMTGLRRWEEPINLDQSASVPCGFIFELTNELSPSDITDGFGQTVVLNQILDCQTLNAYHLVFANDASRELVLVVTPTVIDTSMYTSYFQTGFVPVLRSLLLFCMPSLCFSQSLFVFCVVAGVAHGLTSREDDHRLETQVKPDLRIDDRERLDLIFDQERGKVSVCTVFCDRDRTGFTFFVDIPMEGDSKGLVHLGKRELFVLPFESVGSIGCRLGILLFLECGVLSTSFKEVLVGFIQMSERLLDWHAGYFFEPGVLLLEIRQHTSKLIVVELLTTLFVGGRSGMQTKVIDEANTSERLRQNALLFVCRVKPILVCSLRLAHWLLTFLALYVFFDDIDDLAISRSLVLFGNFLESFKHLRIDIDGKSLWFHTGILPRLYTCDKGLVLEYRRLRGPVLPSPKGLAYIPMSE